MENDVQERIRRLYQAYNSQNLEGLSALLAEHVDWPDQGRRLHGRAAVESYWSEQWARTRTRDEVLTITELTPELTKVRVSQIVGSLDGAILSRGAFEHTFGFRDGLVVRLDIRSIAIDHQENDVGEAEAMLRRLYESFNARDIPAVLARLHPDVQWANGLEGGHVLGHEGVRNYWTRQWARIRTQVQPLEAEQRADRAMSFKVRQVVHDLEGGLLLDETVRHLFRVEGGLVTRFDVEEEGGLSSLAAAPS